MNGARLALVLVMVTVLPAPVSVQGATPVRLVSLTELNTRPEEVAISSTHLTLIHFETGDVSMVAVGDPALVTVTVKGPDVLLKAVASSGSTNAFIWQAGRYTQWILVVRQDGKDARLVVVREVGPTPRETSTRPSTEWGQQPTGPTAPTPPPGQPSGAAPAARVAAPEGNTLPSLAPTPAESTTPQMTSDRCGKPAMLDQFVKTLTARQRELFGVFLTEPTLARLQRFLVELTLPQRCDLLAVLSVGAPSPPAPSGAGSAIATPAPSRDNERPQVSPPAPGAPAPVGPVRERP